MSAICGIYYCDGKRVAPETGAAMMRELGVHGADAAGSWQEGQVFFGCQAQHITPESVREVLPYYDPPGGLSITADAIIDNRRELCAKLGIDNIQLGRLPDSLLILQAYRKWGKDCPKYLIGDFSFAIWDENRQELFCAVDHTGTRTFYYYQSSEFFAFATLIKPLFVLPQINKKHNEIWVADFLAMPSVMHQLDPELTFYQDIYLLPAGNTLTVGPAGIIKQVYWQVERRPELKLKSDSEYEEALCEILGEAVRCRLRSIRPVGVMMSGGLDSASVACLAARELAGGGEGLLAFSAVPMAGYRDWLPADRLADETPYIEAVRGHAGNIDVIYCHAEGRHALSDTDRLLAMLEQPYKVFENLFWIDGILAAAQARNVGVVLNGSAGNATISWGAVQPYLLSMLRAGQWRRLFRESWAAARRQRNPLRALYGLWKTLLPENLQNYLNRTGQCDWFKILQDLSPLNPDFAQRIVSQERFRRFGYDPLFINRRDSFETRQKMLSPGAFSHLGGITAKQSLAHNLVLRDPTMDKRIIEFCLSVPESQYVQNGIERFLLRRAMAGVLPDKVRMNEEVRGRQSADWTQRMQYCWPEVASEIRNIGAREAEQKYLNVAKICGELTKFNTLKDNAAKDFNLRMLIRSLVFSRFLEYEEKSG